MDYQVINKVRIMCINNANKKSEKIIINFNWEDYKQICYKTLFIFQILKSIIYYPNYYNHH